MERLQKVMAHYGVASRRKSEQLIIEGKVKVNGEIITKLGTKIDPDRDSVEVDGRPLKTEQRMVYIALNKPEGYVTTVKDTHGRKTVLDLMPEIKERIYPVGRLDLDSEGLLLLTNDGNLSFALTHPSHEVKKTYIAVVEGNPGEDKLRKLRTGIYLEDGKTAPAGIEVLNSGKNTEVKVEIHEGRKRQVKRMFAKIGFPVVRLKRVRFGPIFLKRLKKGEYRELTTEEIKSLKEIEKAVFKKYGKARILKEREDS